MEVTYSGATSEQQQAVEAVFGSLLNLPESAIPLTLSVEFVADPLPDPNDPHREFGFTVFSYGSTTATIRIRDDAPDWPYPYEGIQALNEVAIHELGHALFAALPEDKRIAVAQMFGADSDDFAELSPEGTAWEDQIIEAIAETFKDAFLPVSLRKHSVHTNVTLSISRYPEFRALFRQSLEEGVGSGTGEPLADQIDGLEILDKLDSSETPLGEPWIQWPQAHHIGHVWDGSVSFVAYRCGTVPTASEPHPTPRYVAALWSAQIFSDVAAVVRLVSDWTSASDEMRIELYASADDSSGGSGYRLYAEREGGESYGLTEPFNEINFYFRLERWDLGILSEVLNERSEVKLTIGRDIAISVVDGTVKAWREDSGGNFVEVMSVADSAHSEGYCGIGLHRNDGGINASQPGLRYFRAGEVVPGEPVPGQSIDVPQGSLGPELVSRGIQRPNRRVASSHFTS